jgi:hypothetical protein
MTAPEESVTVPTILAVACASTRGATPIPNNNKPINSETDILGVFARAPISSPLVGRFYANVGLAAFRNPQALAES